MNDDYAAEPASEPVPFPQARVHNAVRFQCRVYIPSEQQSFVAPNVIRPNHQGGDDSDSDASRVSSVSTGDPQVAYMIVRELQRALVGMVYLAMVLNRRIGEENDPSHDAEWEVTDQQVAIKEIDLTRGSVTNEVRAMRYIQNYSNLIQNLNHVSVPRDVLFEAINRRHLWMVMPYHGSEFPYQRIDPDGRMRAWTEHEARELFRRMLSAMAEMQQMRLSHRDVSAENLILDGQRCVVIDFATNIRLPYDNDQRLLVKNTQRVGKVQYMAPEMFNRLPYDGFAVDLWACAIMLFRMTTGCFAFQLPSPTAPNFTELTSNDPIQFTVAFNRIIQIADNPLPMPSPLLMDLLQRMMAYNPTERLSLRQIQNHAWMTMQL